MTDFISREKLLERIDDIWDCADMVFEPVDQCCRDSDCSSCKWRETKAAIRKIAANIPAADVRPVVMCKDCRHRDPEDHKCDCGGTERQGCPFKVADDYFCAYGER